MFEVRKGRTYRSKTLKLNGLGLLDESRRGQTHVAYDINDFASATVPGDGVISFVRVEEFDATGSSLGEGPIFVVPPADFFATAPRNLVLNGTAPEVTGPVNNLPPAGVMILVLPRFADECTITNNETGANNLYISFGSGLQEYQLAFGESVTFTESGVSSVYLRSDTAGGAGFTARFSVVNGIQA